MNQEETFIKKIKTKFENFQFLSLVLALVSIFTLVTLIVGFVFFQLDNVYRNLPGEEIHQENQLFGGIFFVMMILGVIAAIVAAYLSLPYILNKTKLSPVKTTGIISLIAGSIMGVNAIFAFLTLVLAEDPSPILWIIAGILFLLSAAAHIIMFLFSLSVKMYMPKPITVKGQVDKNNS